jgi:hypothetical protein
MRITRVLAPISLNTLYVPVVVGVPAFSVALQARSAADAYLAHETTGSYWTLKSGSSISFDLEGRPLWNVAEATNLVKNGTFTGDAMYWTFGDAGVHYNANNVIKDGAGTLGISQTIDDLIPGDLYKVVVTMSGYGTSGLNITIGGGSAGETLASDATHTQYLLAGRSSSDLLFTPVGTGSRWTLDTIELYHMSSPFLLAKAGGAVTLEVIALV